MSLIHYSPPDRECEFCKQLVTACVVLGAKRVGELAKMIVDAKPYVESVTPK